MPMLSIAQVLETTSLAEGDVWQVLDAASGLAAAGHRVLVVTRPDAEVARRCREAGAEHLALPLRSRVDVGSMRRLAAEAAARGLDVVHAYSRVAHGVAAGASMLKAPFALVVSRRSSFRIGLGGALALHSRRVQRVVVTCEAVRTALTGEGRVQDEKVTVVYDGVDPARFDPSGCDPGRVREELGVAAGAPLVGHVGMRDWQGWKELLRAFPAVLAAHPGARLLLVACASRRQRAAVLESAAEMGLGEAVAATLRREDMPDVLAACDLVVDASWAGAGIAGSLREAMALGKPVVATTVAGNPELVEQGVSGILVEPRDVATLAAAVVRLLREPELAASLGEAGRRRVLERFSAAARVDRLVGVYASVRPSGS